MQGALAAELDAGAFLVQGAEPDLRGGAGRRGVDARAERRVGQGQEAGREDRRVDGAAGMTTDSGRTT